MVSTVKAMQRCIELGKAYLISQITNGLCLEFHKQFKHGPSWAWTTACVGSTLSEFGFKSEKMLEAILSLQHENGGWSYNTTVLPDADSTLRVIQFLKKIGFIDRTIIVKAEQYVILHQLQDGGFTTYLPEEAKDTGYTGYERGWCSSHPCVTALAVNQLQDISVVERAFAYLQNQLKKVGATAYWWKTRYYVLYETGRSNGAVFGDDPVEIALALLLKSKLGIYDPVLIQKLLVLQRDNGSLPPSKQLRVPKPHQPLDEITGKERIIEDELGIFSTCATIVAISRQLTLLQ